MSLKNYYRIAKAAELCDVKRSTLITAVRGGLCKSAESGCGLPMVTLDAVQKWAATERKRGPKAAKPKR